MWGSWDTGSKASSSHCPCYPAVHHCWPTIFVLWDSLVSSVSLSPPRLFHVHQQHPIRPANSRSQQQWRLQYHPVCIVLVIKPSFPFHSPEWSPPRNNCSQPWWHWLAVWQGGVVSNGCRQVDRQYILPRTLSCSWLEFLITLHLILIGYVGCWWTVVDREQGVT